MMGQASFILLNGAQHLFKTNILQDFEPCEFMQVYVSLKKKKKKRHI